MKVNLAIGPANEQHGEVTFLQFWCPGCNDIHQIVVAGSGVYCWTWNAGSGVYCWTWNNDKSRPDIYPSICVAGKCHSIIRNGKIEFHPDCDHGLRGQTVDLPDWPY